MCRRGGPASAAPPVLARCRGYRRRPPGPLAVGPSRGCRRPCNHLCPPGRLPQHRGPAPSRPAFARVAAPAWRHVRPQARGKRRTPRPRPGPRRRRRSPAAPRGRGWPLRPRRRAPAARRAAPAASRRPPRISQAGAAAVASAAASAPSSPAVERRASTVRTAARWARPWDLRKSPLAISPGWMPLGSRGRCQTPWSREAAAGIGRRGGRGPGRRTGGPVSQPTRASACSH
mmetsp:Transcript_98291/g.306061  ORF Transcript_98291/g.306061 Transcript_98291/m.306061 type:complete len:231 (-) Transcript_98291:188-880(-)